jgi:hypothetical protein
MLKKTLSFFVKDGEVESLTTVRPWLKGQCHEMVVEVRPLFPLQNPSSQCYGPSSRVPIDVKTGYQIRHILLSSASNLDSECEISTQKTNRNLNKYY